MKLPNVEQAVVVESKITEYLLSETHPDGQEKAQFFTRFGFSVAEWEVMAQALWQHAADHEVARIATTPHGTKYIVEGELSTPDGRNPEIRTIWIIEEGDIAAHLITAYPLKR